MAKGSRPRGTGEWRRNEFWTNGASDLRVPGERRLYRFPHWMPLIRIIIITFWQFEVSTNNPTIPQCRDIPHSGILTHGNVFRALEEQNVKNARSSAKCKQDILRIAKLLFLFTIRTTKCRLSRSQRIHGVPTNSQPHNESVSFGARECVSVREYSFFLCPLRDVYLSHIPIAQSGWVNSNLIQKKKRKRKNASNSNVTRNISDFVFQSVWLTLFEPSVNMDFIAIYSALSGCRERGARLEHIPELVRSTNLIVCTTYIASKLESFESQPPLTVIAPERLCTTMFIYQ